MATDVDTRIACEIYKMLTNWKKWLGKIAIFDAFGSETVDEAEARHFFARDINMMVVFDDTPSERSVTVHINSSSVANETIRGIWDTFRNAIRTKFQVSCNLTKSNETIAPRDFSHIAKKRAAREAMDGKAAQIARTPEGAEAILRHLEEGGTMLDPMGSAILEMDRHCRMGSAEDRALLERMGTPAGHRAARAIIGA